MTGIDRDPREVVRELGFIDPAALTSDEAVDALYEAIYVDSNATKDAARAALTAVASALADQGTGTREVEQLRALCADAARHLRTLPAQTELADIRLAERLEAASGSATTDPPFDPDALTDDERYWVKLARSMSGDMLRRRLAEGAKAVHEGEAMGAASLRSLAGCALVRGRRMSPAPATTDIQETR